MWILFTGENLRALRFKSSEVFLKRPPVALDLDSQQITGMMAARHFGQH